MKKQRFSTLVNRDSNLTLRTELLLFVMMWLIINVNGDQARVEPVAETGTPFSKELSWPLCPAVTACHLGSNLGKQGLAPLCETILDYVKSCLSVTRRTSGTLILSADVSSPGKGRVLPPNRTTMLRTHVLLLDKRVSKAN